MPDRRVLVSGAAGFIGRWSVPPLLRAGFDVHAVLSKAPRCSIPEELSGATVEVADVLAETEVDALLDRVRPTHLLHFAWIATPGEYWTSSDNHRWLAASRYLLRAFHARGGLRVTMAGSCAEYDWARVDVCDEGLSPLADESTTAPSAYAAGKIAMQRDLAKFSQATGLSSSWGRIFFQFGPHEHPQRLVPSVIRHLLANREAPCTSGSQVRSFLHVSDVGDAFASVLCSSQEGPVNIGSDEAISVADLIQRIGRQLGRSELLRLGARPTPVNEPPVLLPAVHRLRDEVKWRPRFSLDEGLSAAVDWWRGRVA